MGSPYKAIIADRSYAAHQQLADRARRARRHQRRLRERQSELASQAAPRPSPPAPTPAPAPALPPPLSRIQAFAYSLVGGSQFGCLKALWDRESGWNIYASNPSSGAYGIPQALPGSKMASAGPDWQTNPYTQVKWGVGYIDDSYGSACAAWSHEETSGWY